MPKTKIISSYVKITDDPFLQKLDQAQRQWQKIQIARKLTVKSERQSTETSAIHYSEICFRRYLNNKKQYNRQFLREIKKTEQMQPTANDAMRFHRHFAITTLWPPLHSKQEIGWTLRQLRSALSPEERKRIEKIISSR